MMFLDFPVTSILNLAPKRSLSAKMHRQTREGQPVRQSTPIGRTLCKTTRQFRVRETKRDNKVWEGAIRHIRTQPVLQTNATTTATKDKEEKKWREGEEGQEKNNQAIFTESPNANEIILSLLFIPLFFARASTDKRLGILLLSPPTTQPTILRRTSPAT